MIIRSTECRCSKVEMYHRADNWSRGVVFGIVMDIVFGLVMDIRFPRVVSVPPYTVKWQWVHTSSPVFLRSSAPPFLGWP